MAKVEPDNSSVQKKEPVTMSFLTSFISASTYDGKSDNLHKFIKDCDYSYSLANETQKYMLYRYICTKIIGKADDALSCRQINTWEECKEFLIENFTETKNSTHLAIELSQCRQRRGESIIGYTQRVDQIFSKLTRAVRNETTDQNELIGKYAMVKQNALQAFLLGVLPQYRTTLIAREPKGYEEAAQIAINQERLTQAASFSSDSSQEKFCSFCKKPGHEARNCFKQNKPVSTRVFQTSEYQERDRNHFKKKVEKNNSNTDFKSMTCFYCNKPGHIKKNCFKYKNSQANFNKNSGNEKSQSLTAGVQLASVQAEF